MSLQCKVFNVIFRGVEQMTCTFKIKGVKRDGGCGLIGEGDTHGFHPDELSHKSFSDLIQVDFVHKLNQTSLMFF